MPHAISQLAPTVAAMRDVLAAHKARREQKSVFESNGRGRAFDARKESVVRKQGDKPHKKGGPKRAEQPDTFDEEWTTRFWQL
eukprot:6205184-Pleurochrysis_carterae.AAC.2